MTSSWGWRSVIDQMDAAHCRALLNMGAHVLAVLGWSDADMRRMAEIANGAA